MKKLLALIAFGSASLVFADQYNQNGNYYQKKQHRNSQGYYQHQSPRNQSYGQKQVNYSYSSYDEDDQGNVSDQEIHRNIEEALSSGWLSKGFENVFFEVRNGNVTLRGSVDTLNDKNQVEDNVREIEGVRQINNQIRYTQNSGNQSNTSYYNQQQRHYQSAYGSQIGDNQKNGSDSQLKSSNSQLKGSNSQMQNSEKKYPQDFASSQQDHQINMKIRDELNAMFPRYQDDLTIRTTNGVVMISGTVKNIQDIQKINYQIKNIEGVKSVNDELTVKNR